MHKKELIITLAVLALLVIAGCAQKNKMVTCPDGTNVTDASQCPSAVQPAAGTPPAEQPKAEPTAETTSPPAASPTTGAAVALPPQKVPATVVAPVAVKTETKTASEKMPEAVLASTSGSPVSFTVINVIANKYNINGIQYNITNNRNTVFDDGFLEIYIEDTTPGTIARAKKMDLPRLKPGESKVITKSVNADFIMKGVSQVVYFSVLESNLANGKNTLLAETNYSVVFR